MVERGGEIEEEYEEGQQRKYMVEQHMSKEKVYASPVEHRRMNKFFCIMLIKNKFERYRTSK